MRYFDIGSTGTICSDCGMPMVYETIGDETRTVCADCGYDNSFDWHDDMQSETVFMRD